MVELIWGILNITILIYFIIICFKSTKIIREKLGAFAVLIFVFGLLSFIGAPNDENPKIKIFDLQNQTKEAKLNRFKGNTYLLRRKLDDNLMTKIELSISFGENENGKNLLTAYTSRTGFVSGTNWKTENISVEKSKTENKCFYNISGILEWRLLGLKIYSEPKDFDGEVELKK
jgi:hypothetical protein